jgi:hypothetical protein
VNTDLEPREERLAVPRRIAMRGEEWERQPGETSKAFSCFVVYRNLGAERSVSKVAQSPNIGSTPSTLSKWAENYRWVERARAYDNMLDRVKVAEERRAIEEMTRRHIKAGQALQKVGEAYVTRHLSTDAQIAKLGPRNALAYIRQGIDVEREGRGLTEDRPVGDTNVQINVLAAGAKADLFARIGQMAANMAAVKALNTNTAGSAGTPDEEVFDAELVDDVDPE